MKLLGWFVVVAGFLLMLPMLISSNQIGVATQTTASIFCLALVLTGLSLTRD